MSAAEIVTTYAQGHAQVSESPQLPPGIVVGGPMVRAKLRETYLLLTLMYSGAVAGVAWTLIHGVGRLEIAVFVGMFALTTFGIGAGMHRLLVHRSFRCGPVMRTFFCAIAQMAVQGPIVKWVANHRRHHIHADDVGDPHSPHYDSHGNKFSSLAKGLLHAQSRWVIDDTVSDNEFYAKDILEDPIAMFFVRTRWFWYAMSTILIPGTIGYAFGGLSDAIGCVLFSGFLRAVILQSTSLAVGSICHNFGYRRFNGLPDKSTNELLMTLITFGEGLHNNHHRFPRDAYLSHAWYEFDLNGLLILALGKLGLVHDIVDAAGRHRTEATSP
jgi:stearoyl-CoA desaturase (delta-9 desaturase)